METGEKNIRKKSNEGSKPKRNKGRSFKSRKFSGTAEFQTLRQKNGQVGPSSNGKKKERGEKGDHHPNKKIKRREGRSAHHTVEEIGR